MKNGSEKFGRGFECCTQTEHEENIRLTFTFRTFSRHFCPKRLAIRTFVTTDHLR